MISHTVAHYKIGVCTQPTLRGANHFNTTGCIKPCLIILSRFTSRLRSIRSNAKPLSWFAKLSSWGKSWVLKKRTSARSSMSWLVWPWEFLTCREIFCNIPPCHTQIVFASHLHKQDQMAYLLQCPWNFDYLNSSYPLVQFFQEIWKPWLLRKSNNGSFLSHFLSVTLQQLTQWTAD